MSTQSITHHHKCTCGQTVPTRGTRYRRREFVPHGDPLNPAVVCRYTGTYVTR